MSTPPILSPRILSRLPKAYQDEITVRRQRSDVLNEETKKYRSVSDFLEARMKALSSDIDYITHTHRGLEIARENSTISADEFRVALQPFLPPARLLTDEIHTLTRQRKLISEDLEEEVSTKRQRIEGPGIGIYIRAYTTSILQRVMGASAKQKAGKLFNARAFKADVNAYYGIKKGSGYCHILGSIIPADDVKAAHIVPKSLTQPEIAHLFGCEAKVDRDPRNAVSLHKHIEIGLDTGVIVIVPIIQQGGNSIIPSRWKCVLIDEGKRKQVFHQVGNRIRRWGDIDGQELVFLNNNRPAKRYLYFRFVMTYVLWKKEGANSLFTSKVETLKDFWPTPGPYLRRSMLTALARNISGSNLPETLVQNRTFSDDEYLYSGYSSTIDPDLSHSISTSSNASILAAHDIQKALLVSINKSSAYSESAYSSTSANEEDEEEDGLVFEDCIEAFP